MVSKEYAINVFTNIVFMLTMSKYKLLSVYHAYTV